MSTVHRPEKLAELRSRLSRLSPTSERRWGRMTPHQAVCHLADAFRFSLGERPTTPVSLPIPTFLIRVLALHTPLPWPKGSPTLPEFDQEQKGTPPEEFDADREALLHLLDRFVETRDGWPRHPAMGNLSRRQWGRWAYRHLDHHLRQFGV